ncbi:MAG TPA: cupredoxin domain-containing protein [Solirubrobacterales bacterium]
MKKLAAFIALALASVALVACGGDDDNGTTATQTSGGAANGAATGGAAAGGGKKAGGAVAGGKKAAESQTISLEADPDGQLAYTTDTLNANAGNVTIDFSNPAAITHDVAVDDSGGNNLGKSDLIAQSSTTLVLKNLKAGSYTFYCTVPGHKEAGMEGTLTVK